MQLLYDIVSTVSYKFQIINFAAVEGEKEGGEEEEQEEEERGGR